MLFLRKKQLLICKIMPSICIRKSKICHVMIFVKVSKMPRADWWLQVLIDCLRRGTMAGEGGGGQVHKYQVATGPHLQMYCGLRE